MFNEDMLLALGPGGRYVDAGHPSELNPADEIRLPWSPEYDMWHEYWFNSTARSRMVVDQMSLLEYFLRFQDVCAVVPATAALHLRERLGIRIRPMQEGPPPQIIYYLKRKIYRIEQAQQFLEAVNRELLRLREMGRHVRPLTEEP